jgi:hypothetical protein
MRPGRRVREVRAHRRFSEPPPELAVRARFLDRLGQLRRHQGGFRFSTWSLGIEPRLRTARPANFCNPVTITRYLASTNVIENPNSAVRRVTNRVSRYRDAEMALRWTATGFLEAEKSFRKIQGHRQL